MRFNLSSPTSTVNNLSIDDGFGTNTDTPRVDDNPLTFEAQLNYFRQSDNSVLTALTIQTDNRELVFENIGGLLTARLNILGRITSVADIRIGKFEDPVVTHATEEELSDVRMRKSAYAKAFVLQPGRYRIDVVVRDISSGATGIQHIGFQVPAFPADRLATSSIVLAAKLEESKRRRCCWTIRDRNKQSNSESLGDLHSWATGRNLSAGLQRGNRSDDIASCCGCRIRTAQRWEGVEQTA